METPDTTIVDVDESSFDQLVIERSRRTPVIVDFWAPWCGPCRVLAPILERLAGVYEGRFVLAKVNSDQNPDLSARFNIRGIPNVKAFVDGAVVDEFSGALPESAVRTFLDRVIPSPAEVLRRKANAEYSVHGNADSALEALAKAIELDPRNDETRLDCIELLLALGRLDEAQGHKEAISILSQGGDRYKQLVARLHFAGTSQDADNMAALQARTNSNPDDLDARMKIANQQVATGDYAAALEQLLEIVKRDRTYRDDAARKTMLQVFSLVGNESDLVREYRRKLASAIN